MVLVAWLLLGGAVAQDHGHFPRPVGRTRLSLDGTWKFGFRSSLDALAPIDTAAAETPAEVSKDTNE